jgi:uracil-DNA glycosylase
MAGYAEIRVALFLFPRPWSSSVDPAGPTMNSIFDINCRRWPRLAAFLDTIRHQQPEYYCKPVPPFGDPKAHLLIVGLAPGMHGANRTGRPFTGDHAGILLYGTLYKFGLASAPTSTDTTDGLTLRNARITNSVKCLPPLNKPTPQEIKVCNAFLQAELEQSPEARVVLALGAIAHTAVLRACGLRVAEYRFAHGAEHGLPGGRILLDSYHCSRYNTQTRRLTAAMFETIVERALALVRERE